METGLRHRLKRVVRQMADQHRHLKPLQAELAEALARNLPHRQLHERFAHYREAIEAHFTLESEMFFPALHGLRPEWEAELEGLDRDHRRLGEELAGIARRIEAGDAAEALDRFVARLREHESVEEALVGRLARDID